MLVDCDRAVSGGDLTWPTSLGHVIGTDYISPASASLQPRCQGHAEETAV